MPNQFTEPSKYVVNDDASDAVFFNDLPVPTEISVSNSNEDITTTWLCYDGLFEATFNPAGTYTFTLRADGYDDAVFVIAVVPTPEAPPQDAGE